MKCNLFKLLGACAVLLVATSASAAPILFQGSSTTTAAVPLTPAQARAAWEAELLSFSTDTIDGVSGSNAPFTTNAGNTYAQTGNGSIINGNSNSIRGDRNGSTRIEFDVIFPGPVNAVGFDVIDNDGGGMILELTDAFTGIVSSFNFTSVAGSGRTEFFGVVFDTTTFISQLRVSGTDPGGITTWDNFSTGVGQNAVQPSGVPVSGTLLLLGLGLAAVAGSRRTRRGAQA